MLAFEKRAEANGKEDNEWHAAKSFEMCALLAKDCAGVDETVAYAQRARGVRQRPAERRGARECPRQVCQVHGRVRAGCGSRRDAAIEMLEDDEKHVYAANWATATSPWF